MEKIRIRSAARKSILVTGGAGFLGSHLCDRLLDPDPFFLEIEHFGARFANEHAVGGLLFRESPFLKLKHIDGRDEDAERISTLWAELTRLRAEHRALGWTLKSRTKLMRQLLKITMQKGKAGRF